MMMNVMETVRKMMGWCQNAAMLNKQRKYLWYLMMESM
ncbi:hypothetical protein METP1_02457 [Methanosarcinales archaeon]|nr:hypothetical protein METP1_02457 [Methanosarcinales archaeon]